MKNLKLQLKDKNYYFLPFSVMMLDPRILANSLVSVSKGLTDFLLTLLESLKRPSQNLLSLRKFKMKNLKLQLKDKI